MACIVGDETGLVKVVDLTKATIPKVSYQVGCQDRDDGVMGIVPGRHEGEYFVSHLGGKVTVMRGGQEGRGPIDAVDVEGTLLPPASPSAIHFDKASNSLITVDDEGNVQSVSVTETKDGSLTLDTTAGFVVTGPVTCVIFHTHEDWGLVIGVGGRQNEISMYKMSTGERVWGCRELPHCSLGLRQKVFPSAACVLGTGELFVTTGYKQLRTYELKGKARRPTIDWTPEWLDDVRIFCVRAYKDSEAIFADNTGSVYRVCMVKKQLLMKYRGCSGTARDVSIHPTLPFVISAGLPRKVYVHDINTGKLVSTCYLKQRLNTVLFCPADPFTDKYTHSEAEPGKTTEDPLNELWMDLKAAKKRKDTGSKPDEEGENETDKPTAGKKAKKRRVVVVKRKIK
eukprot:TRINITY_DN15001_c0_g2_i1.p1 TRINITY_DN15001_c0_g2~~TRINITY_DN15001_c0_g2_i1.p1  ORF type:complete len:408 (+),score=90.49 TRINITY_DN15001_c0_g2_i1:31-1224(+)